MSIPEFLTDLPLDWRVVEAKVSRLGEDEPPFGISYEDLLEDLIVVHSDRLQLALEIDWLPERSPSGQLILSAIDFSTPERLADSYARPRRTFATRSLRDAIEQLRAWMVEFAAHEDAV
jgi:hypothetical protein